MGTIGSFIGTVRISHKSKAGCRSVWWGSVCLVGRFLLQLERSSEACRWENLPLTVGFILRLLVACLACQRTQTICDLLRKQSSNEKTL